ncbi:hypothetical protein TNCV_4950211 [Trichonephila clavipes]|nr:hypothetical protein TNCV_4950211 [Trichonephila clavipes]
MSCLASLQWHQNSNLKQNSHEFMTMTTRQPLLHYPCGRGCLEVKVTDSSLACHDFKPSTAEDPSFWGPPHCVTCVFGDLQNALDAQGFFTLLPLPLVAL